MRFEAKHSYFKQLAGSLGNFINLPYSLASRHQHYQCYLNVDSDNSMNSVNDVQVRPGTSAHYKNLLISIKALM